MHACPCLLRLQLQRPMCHQMQSFHKSMSGPCPLTRKPQKARAGRSEARKSAEATKRARTGTGRRVARMPMAAARATTNAANDPLRMLLISRISSNASIRMEPGGTGANQERNAAQGPSQHSSRRRQDPPSGAITGRARASRKSRPVMPLGGACDATACFRRLEHLERIWSQIRCPGSGFPSEAGLFWSPSCLRRARGASARHEGPRPGLGCGRQPTLVPWVISSHTYSTRRPAGCAPRCGRGRSGPAAIRGPCG